MSAGSLRRHPPDPARAHGAWVYLIVSILAGVLPARGHDGIAALRAGRDWDRVKLKRLGSREALFAASWTVVSDGVVHVLAR